MALARNRLFQAMLAPAAVLAGLAASASGLTAGIDRLAYDALSRIRLAAGAFPRWEPVVVAIDAPSLRDYGRWPWPRVRLAGLVRRISFGGPSAIGLDLLLVDRASGTAELAAALRSSPAILAERLDLRRTGRGPFMIGAPEFPASELDRASRGLGFIDFFPDSDGVARRVPVSVQAGGRNHLSLAAAMASLAGRLPAAAPMDGEIGLTIGAEPRRWPTISAGDVLAGRVEPRAWHGRAVLIGLTAPGAGGDSYLTPVRALGRVPGVYLHAFAYATLTSWGPVRNLPSISALGLALLIAAGSCLLMSGKRPWSMAALYLFTIGAVASGSAVLFLSGWWWPPSLPMAAVSIATAGTLVEESARTLRRERRLRRIFARFVSADVMERILAGPEPALGGEAREITVLFADLRGFTALAESRPAEEVASLLNSHLALMSAAIMEAGGLVDKFMGDAVMGIFGAPLAAVDHRARALRAALEIQRALDRPGCLPPGIGLASGRAVVGHVGAPDRLSYTAVGDPVNLAARLEEMAGPREILAAAACFDGSDPGAGWEPLGEIAIRGRSGTVSVYKARA